VYAIGLNGQCDVDTVVDNQLCSRGYSSETEGRLGEPPTVKRRRPHVQGDTAGAANGRGSAEDVGGREDRGVGDGMESSERAGGTHSKI
jgi:hypothetical protein